MASGVKLMFPTFMEQVLISVCYKLCMKQHQTSINKDKINLRDNIYVNRAVLIYMKIQKRFCCIGTTCVRRLKACTHHTDFICSQYYDLR